MLSCFQARVLRHTSPPTEPVTRGFSISGPGLLRVRIVISPWYRSSEPVQFRSMVPIDGRDECAWTGHVPGVTRVSSRSIPDPWVDGAGLEQVLEYRVPKARPQLEVALFPSAVRSGDGSMQQLGNSVSVVITFEPDGSAPSVGAVAHVAQAAHATGSPGAGPTATDRSRFPSAEIG